MIFAFLAFGKKRRLAKLKQKSKIYFSVFFFGCMD